MIHSSGKRGRYKRYFSMILAFIMVCSVFIPAVAKSTGNETEDDTSGKAVSAITYEFYSDGELYDSQTVKDGETLKEPSEPDKDGNTFKGWYTSQDGGSKFTDFSKQTVKEEKTVKLYARWEAVKETELEEDSNDADSSDIAENNEGISDEKEASEEQNDGKAEEELDKSDKETADTEEETNKGNESVEDEKDDENNSPQTDIANQDKTEAVSDKEDSSKQEETESASDVNQSDEKSEDSDKSKENDTENVTKKDDMTADSSDNSEDMEKNVTVTRPQTKLDNGISTFAISGPRTVAVGNTIILQGNGNNTMKHSWSAEPLGYVSLSNANSSTVSVSGVRSGQVQITHQYYSFWGGTQTETYTLEVTEASTEQSYDLYMYTLIPGKDEGSNKDPDQVWNGMGIGSISNVLPPSSYKIDQIIDNGYGNSGAVINCQDQKNREYPSIYVQSDDKWYQYAKNEEQANQEGYYTIEWMRVIVANGANDGNNEFNKPGVPSGTNTYHLDGVVILNEKNRYTVQFALKDAGQDDFAIVDPEKYSKRVDAGTNAGTLARPNIAEPTKYPQTKTVDGIQYKFDGWYSDEACTKENKVDFDSYQIDKHTTFYARYVPVTTNITVEKQVVGTSSADTEFSFTCTYTDVDGTVRSTSLSLKDKASGVVEDIPVGAELILKETNAGGYTTSAKYGDQTIRASETTGEIRTMTATINDTDKKIVVTNQKKTSSITVQKQVTGNLGDYQKEFDFTASWNDGEQKSDTFKLKHDGSHILDNLPVGTQVTISENRDGYSLVSIKQGTEELNNIITDNNTSSCTVTVTEDPITITFTNEKEATVDVGVRMDNLPYIMMLALVLGGATAVWILRRRHN